MMNSTEPCKYDGKSFRKFLVDNGISPDSANSYASYLNGISDLLGKPIDALAANDEVLNDELRQIHIYDRGKWTSALKWLFKFFTAIKSRILSPVKTIKLVKIN